VRPEPKNDERRSLPHFSTARDSQSLISTNSWGGSWRQGGTEKCRDGKMNGRFTVPGSSGKWGEGRGRGKSYRLKEVATAWNRARRTTGCERIWELGRRSLPNRFTGPEEISSRNHWICKPKEGYKENISRDEAIKKHRRGERIAPRIT